MCTQDFIQAGSKVVIAEGGWSGYTGRVEAIKLGVASVTIVGQWTGDTYEVGVPVKHLTLLPPEQSPSAPQPLTIYPPGSAPQP